MRLVRISGHFPIALVTLFYIAFRSLYWNSPPIWDGLVFYRDVQNAMHAPYTVTKFMPYGHTSLLFLPLMGIPELFFPGNYFLFSAWLTALGVAGILGFYALSGLLTKYTITCIERALASLIFAFWPAVLANMINFNLDQGVLVFFIFYWLFLQRGNQFLAATASLFLMFSKASGLLLLGFPWLYGALTQTVGGRLMWCRGRLCSGFITLAAVGGFFAWKTVNTHGNPLYMTSPKLEELFKSIDHPQFQTVLLQIFVLSFSWCLSLLILGGFCKPGNTHLSKRNKWLPPIGSLPAMVIVIIGMVVALTRYLPFTNVRYVMPIFVVLIIAACQANAVMFRSATTRIIVLSVLGTLILASNFRTLDPMSRLAFGTFSFGNRSLLKMNSITLECCGSYGRDQLVYNLELMRGLNTLELFFADAKIGPEETLVLSHASTFFEDRGEHLLIGRVNKHDFTRTADFKESFSPKFSTVRTILHESIKPKQLYYLDLPIFPERGEISALRGLYSKSSFKDYEFDGYSIRAYLFSMD